MAFLSKCEFKTNFLAGFSNCGFNTDDCVLSNFVRFLDVLVNSTD